MFVFQGYLAAGVCIPIKLKLFGDELRIDRLASPLFDSLVEAQSKH